MQYVVLLSLFCALAESQSSCADWCNIQTCNHKRCSACKACSNGGCDEVGGDYSVVNSGENCESSNLMTITRVEDCSDALQRLMFNSPDPNNASLTRLFEIDLVNNDVRPPGCSASNPEAGPYPQFSSQRGYFNTDFSSPRNFAAESASFPPYIPVGHCSSVFPCMCKSVSPRCTPRPTLPYVRVESGTCQTNGFEDYLDMTECTQVLAENFYKSDNGSPIPFGIHDVEGTFEPPGCWPLTPLFLQVFPTSSRGTSPEACIGRNQSIPRDHPFGYCSPRIPCYCKP